jgi:hypothetical protein
MTSIILTPGRRTLLLREGAYADFRRVIEESARRYENDLLQLSAQLRAARVQLEPVYRQLGLKFDSDILGVMIDEFIAGFDPPPSAR